MTTEHLTVEVFAVFSDLADGREHIVRRTFNGDDHDGAVADTVKSLVGAPVRIREVLSFGGPPRRWTAEYGAKAVTEQ